MTTAIHVLDATRGRKILAAQLCCSGPASSIRAALVADHIRTQVWSPSARGENGRPIHTARILSALRRNLRGIYLGSNGSQLADAEFGSVHTQLERIGDVVHVGDGYWIPGPLRFVQSSGLNGFIVTGGLPTAMLKAFVEQEIQSCGPLRQVSALSRSNEQLSETVGEWLGISETIDHFGERILSWARANLVPQADIEDTSIEIYAPDVFRTLGRLGYWMDAKEFREAQQTLRLFRPKVSERWTFDRPDYLGVFATRPDGARVTRAVPLPRDVAYRLRFFFDRKFDAPKEIKIYEHHDIWAVDLKFNLPEPESKLLGFCWHEDLEKSKLLIGKGGLALMSEATGALGIEMAND